VKGSVRPRPQGTRARFVIGRIAESRCSTRAGAALLLGLCAAGFVALSWPTGAQEIKYRPRNLIERLFTTRDLEQQPRAVRPRVTRPRAAEPRVAVKPRRGLLERLFSSGDDEVVPLPPLGKKSRTKAKSKAGAASSQIVRVQEPEALPKAETARSVLVIGDFLADGLAEGLVSAYSQNPDIEILDRADGSSGLVRSDFHDWPADAKALIDSEKPEVVVVMIGTNDRQQMKIGETREQPMSENWLKEYQVRADALAAAIKERHLPFVWVGLPAFKSATISSDLLTLNDIYRKSVENAGGTFVDIWDGFVDENGAFVMNGPDMNGQPVRLRGADGISLSKPGKRKVAFYVEKPLNKLLGNEASPAPGPGPETVGPVAPADIFVDRTQPMAIDDPDLDGGELLLGATTAPKNQTRTAAERLVVEGVASAPAPGRADDFGGAAPPVAATGAPPDAGTSGPSAAAGPAAPAASGPADAAPPARMPEATAAGSVTVINR
jgi:uncharacterized protein